MIQTYQRAIESLNGLKSNKEVLKEIRKNSDYYALFNLPKIRNFLQRLHILNKIDDLQIIHISGTKGKGSTCAYIDQILRNHGFKTGLFSSPHMVTVRERIRLIGEPLSYELFNRHFWPIYTQLLETKGDHYNSMPTFFQFLTCMAFDIFIKEKVDVAIMEVGIGGEYDSTNIITKPIVCGITSLDIDHTSILGNTISKIAWHKAGIIKPKVPVYTVLQPPGALDVLSRRAKDNQCILYICPPIDDYQLEFDLTNKPLDNCGTPNGDIECNSDIIFSETSKNLGGQMFKINASLAVQIARAFIDSVKTGRHPKPLKNNGTLNGYNGPYEYHTKIASPFKLTEPFINAIKDCQLDGRSQILEIVSNHNQPITFYLDGAHTSQSIKYSFEWFQKAFTHRRRSRTSKRILVFNCTGDRNPMDLLKPLIDPTIFTFDSVIFCPNIIDLEQLDKETLNKLSDIYDQMEICRSNLAAWTSLHGGIQEKNNDDDNDVDGTSVIPFLNKLKSRHFMDGSSSLQNGFHDYEDYKDYENSTKTLNPLSPYAQPNYENRAQLNFPSSAPPIAQEISSRDITNFLIDKSSCNFYTNEYDIFYQRFYNLQTPPPRPSTPISYTYTPHQQPHNGEDDIKLYLNIGQSSLALGGSNKEKILPPEPIIFGCVKSALKFIKDKQESPSTATPDDIHVYVTGSLYLVGAFLKLLKK